MLRKRGFLQDSRPREYATLQNTWGRSGTLFMFGSRSVEYWEASNKEFPNSVKVKALGFRLIWSESVGTL